MNKRSGLSFADVLILVAIVLLLAALAIPKFVKTADYGNEEDDVGSDTPSQAASNAAPRAADNSSADTHADTTLPRPAP